MVPQVKVSWQGLPKSCNSWELVYAIVNAYPRSPAWGQAAAEGEGNVTTRHIQEAIKVKRRTDGRQAIREAHLRSKPMGREGVRAAST